MGRVEVAILVTFLAFGAFCLGGVSSVSHDPDGKRWSGVWRMENGELEWRAEVRSGERRMESGERREEDGEWGVECRRRVFDLLRRA